MGTTLIALEGYNYKAVHVKNLLVWSICYWKLFDLFLDADDLEDVHFKRVEFPASHACLPEGTLISHSKGSPKCAIYSRRVEPLLSGHGLNLWYDVLNHGVIFEERDDIWGMVCWWNRFDEYPWVHEHRCEKNMVYRSENDLHMVDFPHLPSGYLT